MTDIQQLQVITRKLHDYDSQFDKGEFQKYRRFFEFKNIPYEKLSSYQQRKLRHMAKKLMEDFKIVKKNPLEKLKEGMK